MRVAAGISILASLLLLTARAHASPEPASPEPAPAKPDPAAVRAGEANLESTTARSGIVVTLAFGGALTLGFGINDSTGSGGAGTFRIARVATPDTLITLELLGSALFHQVRSGMGADAETTTYTNQVSSFLVGAQHYVNAGLWLRIGLGFGSYVGDEVLLDARAGEPMQRGDIRLAGPAGSVGAGLDVLRLKRFRVSAEICSTGMLTRDGLLSSGGFLIGFSVD